MYNILLLDKFLPGTIYIYDNFDYITILLLLYVLVSLLSYIISIFVNKYLSYGIEYLYILYLSPYIIH